MTQREQISNYIEQFGSITPMQAFFDLGITKLASRISEMRASGEEIVDEWVETKNRYGKTVRFKKYMRGQNNG